MFPYFGRFLLPPVSFDFDLLISLMRSQTTSAHELSFLSQGTLITICFEHYDNVCKHYLQPTRLNVTGGTNSQRRIRIRDYKDRMFHFPLDLCDSYFVS